MGEMSNAFCVPHEVRMTADKGLGVFARAPIEQGRIVWRHTPGIFRVYDEPSFRANIDRMAPAEVIFELTHVHAFGEFPDCLVRALDDGIYINHADHPNLATNKANVAEPTLNAGSPRYLQSVAAALLHDRFSLVALRDIEPGEELTTDYMSDDDGPEYYDELYERFGVREDYLPGGG